MERFKAYFGEQFQSTWPALEAGWAYEGVGADPLLCYDQKDRYVDPQDGARLHKLCPGSRLVMSDSYGHARILGTPELITAIAEFLDRPA